MANTSMTIPEADTLTPEQRTELYPLLSAALTEHGFATDATYNLIDEIIASIATDPAAANTEPTPRTRLLTVNPPSQANDAATSAYTGCIEACQQYGITTSHTEDLIHAAIDSLILDVDDEDSCLCDAIVACPVHDRS